MPTKKIISVRIKIVVCLLIVILIGFLYSLKNPLFLLLGFISVKGFAGFIFYALFSALVFLFIISFLERHKKSYIAGFVFFGFLWANALLNLLVYAIISDEIKVMLKNYYPVPSIFIIINVFLLGICMIILSLIQKDKKYFTR